MGDLPDKTPHTSVLHPLHIKTQIPINRPASFDRPIQPHCPRLSTYKKTRHDSICRIPQNAPFFPGQLERNKFPIKGPCTTIGLRPFAFPCLCPWVGNGGGGVSNSLHVGTGVEGTPFRIGCVGVPFTKTGLTLPLRPFAAGILFPFPFPCFPLYPFPFGWLQCMMPFVSG